MISLIFIGIFAEVSYLIGFLAVLKKSYRPNLFSRIVWLGLALNTLVSVMKLHNQTPTLTLAWVMFLGSLLICIASIFYGDRIFKKNEIIASALLIISLIFWFVIDFPLLNLLISLLAHLIGSIPTVVRVVKNPESENVPFWFFFALASVIGIFSTTNHGFGGYIYLLYYAIFDTGMTLLSARQYRIRRN